MPNAEEDAAQAFEEALAMPPGLERIETLLTGIMRAQQALKEGQDRIEALLGENQDA